MAVSVSSIVEKDKNASIFDLTYQRMKYRKIIWGTITVFFYNSGIFWLTIFLAYILDMPFPHFGLPFGTWYSATCTSCPAYKCEILLLPLLFCSSKNIEVPHPFISISLLDLKTGCVLFCGPKLSKVPTENQMLLTLLCTRLYFQNYFL